jgi:hypothetical protein
MHWKILNRRLWSCCLSLFLALALGACAADAASDEAVAVSDQELWTGPNFQIGVMGIRYDDAGHANKTTEAWSPALDVTALSVPQRLWSVYTTGQTSLTGVRIAMKSQGEAAPFLQGIDFRFGFRGRNSVAKVQGDPVYTPWLSEGGGWSDPSRTWNDKTLDSFAVAIETRPWPANHTNFEWNDVWLWVGVCPPKSSDANCLNPDWKGTTLSLQSLQPGDVTWSHTSSSEPNNPGLPPAPEGVAIAFFRDLN